MPPDDSSGARPTPVVLRIKLRYADIDSMVQRFAPNVGKSGLFLPTRTMHPVGTEVKFELRLSTDQAVLVGLGRVKEVRHPDPNNPRAAFGLGIELMRVTREGRDLILKMLDRRRQLGLSEVALPIPSDIESARRADVETNPRIVLPASPVPTETTDRASGPVLTAPRRSGSMAPIKLASVEPLAPEPPRKKRVAVGDLIGTVLGSGDAKVGPTATTTGNVDEDEVVDVGKALARARALAGVDFDKELEVLLDSSAAPLAIDVEAASAELARQLGGVPVRRSDRSIPRGTPDHASGSARWAPPPTISEGQGGAAGALVEAAAEIAAETPKPDDATPADTGVETPDATTTAAALDAVAAQLAGPISAQPVAPDPAETAVEPAIVAPEPAETAVVAHEVEPVEPAIVAPEPAETAVEPPRDAVDDAATRMAMRDVLPPADEEDVEADEPVDETIAIGALATETVHEAVESGLIHDDLDPDEVQALADGEQEVHADQIDDEIHELEDEDFEEVETTYAGDNPMAELAELEHVRQARRPPTLPNALEARLDEELAQAEAEAEADDMGIGTRALPVGTYNRPPSDFSATADGEGGDIVERPSSDYLATLDADVPPPVHDFDAPSEELDLDNSEIDHDVIDDFEILAESDASDEEPPLDDDEMVDPASVRPFSPPQSSSFSPPQVPPTDSLRSSSRDSDFAMRLDLPEDSELLRLPRRARDFDEDSVDPRVRSAGAALAAFDDDEASMDDSPARRRGPRPLYGSEDDLPSSSYTVPAEIPGIDPRLDTRFAQFDESDVIALPPSMRKSTPTPTPTPTVPPEADLDLESALEALDVDLDDLSIPHASTELRRDVNKPGAIRGGAPQKPPRASTDGGVLIDFDDDE